MEELKAGDHLNEPYLNEIIMGRQTGASAEIYKSRVAALRPWIDAKVQFTLATDAGLEVKGLGPVAWGRLGRIEFDRMEGLRGAGAVAVDADRRNAGAAQGCRLETPERCSRGKLRICSCSMPILCKTSIISARSTR